MSLVFDALRDPEPFVQAHLDVASPSTLLALASSAAVGVGLYGAAMHAFQDAPAMISGGLGAAAAAGLAWTATLPALYILGSLAGSRLSLRSLLLATLVTVSFAGLALLASIPVLWFIELCAPYTWVRALTNVVVFGGVGLSMADVHLRVMERLEGLRLRHFGWLSLLAVLGAELFWVVGLADLS